MRSDTVTVKATARFADGYVDTRQIKIILEWIYLIGIRENIKW
jgi:hypothetical protein